MNFYFQKRALEFYFHFQEKKVYAVGPVMYLLLLYRIYCTYLLLVVTNEKSELKII
jgi:hypothetical protein